MFLFFQIYLNAYLFYREFPVFNLLDRNQNIINNYQLPEDSVRHYEALY